MLAEEEGLPRSRHQHTIQTDEASSLAKNLRKAGMCLLIGGVLAGTFLLGMSVPRVGSAAPPAIQDTTVTVLAGSTEDIISEALGEERQLTSKVKERATEGLFNFAETTPTTPKQPSPLFALCQDVPDWAQPDEGIWSSTPFVDKTCKDLEIPVARSLSNERDQWCNFLSQGVYSRPSANQACCFCGGGDQVEPKCSNMVWNVVESSVNGMALNCDFIDTLPPGNIDSFCDTYAEATFVQDGLTLKEACCACGGGELNMNRNANRRRRRHLQLGGVPGGLGDDEEVKLTDFRDYTTRTVIESPGITNLEFLGLGYDLMRGNPRGSDKSELDPGFRYRVVQLVQTQDELTVDGAFTVPKGTDVKYIHSCKFDKSSTEVSSEQDIRSSLQSEASSSESDSWSMEAGLSINLGFFSIGSSVNRNENRSFSQNSDVKRSAETNTRESLVAFETKAICKEYQASFIPGYDLVLDPTFERTLGALPVPYDSNNRRHRVLWGKFFDNYGTSYVNYLVLGGKQVTSFSMTSQDYSSLVSESVDVSSTMSYEMSQGMSVSASAKKGLKKAAETPTPPTTGGAGAVQPGRPGVAGLNVISINLSQENKNEDDTGGGPELPSKEVSGSFSAEESEATSDFARNLNTAQAAEKISKKNLKFSEYTLGGNPNADWRAWAATVASRPMPVQYRVGSLIDFMTFEEAVAADEAFRDIYGLDLITTREPILEGTTKFGVYTGLGEPLVKSTLDPNNDSRVLMQGGIVGRLDDDGNLPEFREKLADGYCLDAKGRQYDSVHFYARISSEKEFSNADDARSQCDTFCSGLDRAGLQVGMSVGFNQGYSFACSCHYSNGQAPAYGDVDFGPLDNLEISKSPSKNVHTDRGGYNVPTKATGNVHSRCYPNDVYKNRAPIYTFTDTYKGKIGRPRAIFATPIRGFVGIDSAETSSNIFEDFDGGNDPWKGGLFFALSPKLHAGLSVAVTSYGRAAPDLTRTTIPAYSFVTSDSFPIGDDRDSHDFITGVVSPQGLLLDGNKDLVSVSRVKVSNTNENFKVEFKSPMRRHPTVILFPIWFKPDKSAAASGGTVFPSNSAQLMISLIPFHYHKAEFTARFQRTGPVGFSFLAIGPDIPTRNVKHGIVYECTSVPFKSFFNGISKGNDYCSNSEGQNFNQDNVPSHEGVLLKFDEPFSAIPSVIATPIGSPKELDGYSVKCIVESITVRATRVKCGGVKFSNVSFHYKPFPFTVVAFGETEE